MVAQNRFKLDQYFDAALIEGVWLNKRYGLPYIGSARVLFYNQELFTKAGLKTPHELQKEGKWTQEAFLDAARKLTLTRPDGQKQFGYDFGTALQFSGEHVWDFGGDLTDKDRRTCLLDRPNAIAAYEYLQDLIHKHRIVPAAEDRQGVNLVQDGRLAMEEIWRGTVPARRAWPYAWDVAPRPKGKTGQQLTLYKGNSIAIARQTGVPDAAWLTLTFMTGPEADRVWVRDGGATPLKTNVDLFLANRPPENNQYWMDAYKYSRMLPFTPAWGEMNQAFDQEMAGVWQNKRAPRDALLAAVPKINDLLAAVPR
jgi:multiple sugar transport system substrate-binding protein